MDMYQAVTSWAIFLGLGAFFVLYYWPDARRKQQFGGRAVQRQSHSQHDVAKGSDSETKRQPRADGPRRRETENKKPQAPKSYAAAATSAPAAPAAASQRAEPDADDSTRAFAEQMLKARKGEVLTGKKSQEQRVRTVKQSNAVTSDDDGQNDDAISTTAPRAGDVSDMLEPKASGPSVLRVTPSSTPLKEKTNRSAAKEEVVETKKQRQNRHKAEERRLAREAEEQERKIMMEKQRRAAREARGEPAENGMPTAPASAAPANNVWTAAQTSAVPATGAQISTAPLLDTFDAESTGSSAGAMGNSTDATSTTDGGLTSRGLEMGEEEQMALAMQQSGIESGWTTVAVPKKQQKKKKASADGEATPVTSETVKAQPAPGKPAAATKTANGKPKGFQALDVQYGQRSDADPNDPDSWDA